MKFSIVSVSLLISILFFTHASHSSQSCPAAVPEKYAHVKPGNVAAAYFAGWDIYGQSKYTVKDLYPIADKLTHVVYAFVKPNPQTGKCELQDPWADVGANFEKRKKVAGNFAKLIELKKNFPQLKVLLSVGGGTYSKDISEIVQKGLLKTFAKSCVDILDKFEYQFKHTKTGLDSSVLYEYEGLFDGLDLDWEWLNNVVPEEEAKAYQTMIISLKKLLNERTKRQGKRSLLTVALQVNQKVYNALPLKKCVSFVDWFHVMAYNFTTTDGNGVGHNAPICNPWSSFSVDNAISGLMDLDISPHKLVLGVPLYGHVFDKTKNKLGSAFEKTDITGSVTYDQIKKLYVQNALCKYRWNDKSKVPSLYCPASEVFVSFDDERSVQEKVVYAKQKLLRGVVFWKLAGDDEEHNLIKSVF